MFGLVAGFTYITSFGGSLLYQMKKRNLVEPEQVEFNSREDVHNYAIDRITANLEGDMPIESGLMIDKDNNVVIETLGDSHSVLIISPEYVIKDALRIKDPYIKYHGHPESMFRRNRIATQTFSFQDLYSLNASYNCKASVVVNKHKKFCMLRKKDNFTKISEKELKIIEQEFLRAFDAAWANSIKIYKEGEVIHEFYDCQGMHAFWKKVADKYNLEYYTNYGVHEGIDAYEHYYYPDLLEPTAPTSHKDFKL